MRVLCEQSQGEIVEKKSRFIGTIAPAKTEEEAMAFVAAMKKKYYDARHNCWVFIVYDSENHVLCQRSSDDGEPSGTAGRPMLEILSHEGVNNCVLVVTRYFGGVLLGTGGLVRAYQEATKAALENAQFKEEKEGTILSVTTDYGNYGRISYYIESEGLMVDSSNFGADVELNLFLLDEQIEPVKKKLVELTSDNVLMEMGDRVVREV